MIDHTQARCLVRCDECGSTSAAESSSRPGGAQLNAEIDGFVKYTDGRVQKDRCGACQRCERPDAPVHMCRACKVSVAPEPFGLCRLCDPAWLGRALAGAMPPWHPAGMLDAQADKRINLYAPCRPLPEWARFDEQCRLFGSTP